MTAELQVVSLKIGGMFLVMVGGWMARRREYLTPEVTRILGRFVVEAAYPALVFTQMLRTVSPGTLRLSWWIPLLGIALIGFGQLAGWLTAPLFCPKGERRSFVFLASIPNWIYLPLPIAEGLYGESGVRFVLLFNIGAQLILWTMGIGILRGGRLSRESAFGLVTNNGILATLAGIALALLWPVLRSIHLDPPPESAGLLSIRAVVDALSMIGSVTIPLSLLVTGAQLGDLGLAEHRPSARVLGACGIRLLLIPVAVAALMVIGELAVGRRMAEEYRVILLIIAAMPIAVSCSMFIERYEGDRTLSALGIFYSTLFSVITVPAVLALCRFLGF